MKLKNLFITLLMLAAALPVMAQSRNINLTIKVTAAAGVSLQGQAVTLTQTDYSVNYSRTTLDASGSLTLKVYAGNHRLTVARDGYETSVTNFNVTADTTVNVALTESTSVPYALTADVVHNVQTGKNDVTLGWNQEAPVFYDGFEDYESFAINFGGWTGIDGDLAAAAILYGDYMNRGALQYAQIINPMKVEPSWWYDYPILRAYEGQQYVGFVRTGTGEANDDWLISPAITVGRNNEVSFIAGAADVYKEHFQVLITTVTDNPTMNDFNMISSGNYEEIDYTSGWKKYAYDLSAYEGQTVKIAIRYISNANSAWGAFMLKVDNFRVGQPETSASYAPRKAAAKRVSGKSALNPNEQFRVYLDGEAVGTTDEYEYTFTDLEPGTYTLGVQAVYFTTQTEVVDTTITIVNEGFATLTFNVATNNDLTADGATVEIANVADGNVYSATVADGVAQFPSLALGTYMATVQLRNFNNSNADITFAGDTTINVVLQEKVVTPYNITSEIVTEGNKNTVTLKWNQNLTFNDSFEDYDDFAVGSFGEWKSYDNDGKSVYPIGLGSQTNIVTFPGASTPSAPAAIAPMVFNPYTTVPAMAPSDVAVIAPTGQKTVIFFSPQMSTADKWLISPQFDVRQDDVWQFTAKGYVSAYVETIELLISTTGTETGDFTSLGTIDLPSEMWMRYEVDLANYVDQKVYLAIRYVSYDAFFCQIDDFIVGNPYSTSETVDVGAVKNYEVSLDGVLVGTPTEPTMDLYNVAVGTHTATIAAVYATGKSDEASHTFTIDASGIGTVKVELDGPKTYYNLAGQRVERSTLTPGVYIERTATGAARKLVVK